MPAPDSEPRFVLSGLTSDGSSTEVLHLLRSFANLVSVVQRKLDERQLNLNRRFMDLARSGPGEGKLLDLLSFRRYKIAELSVEFAVVEGSGPSSHDVPQSSRTSGDASDESKVRLAGITVSGGDRINAEFRIDGEPVAAVVVPKGDADGS